MDVRSKLSIGASMLAAAFGCAVLASVSWGGGETAPVSAASLPPATTSENPTNRTTVQASRLPSVPAPTVAQGDALKSEDLKKLSLVKSLNLEPGLLDQRVRLSGRAPDAPMSAPPSEPSMTRQDYLRLKDRVEAKENWMFVDQDKLNQDREKSTQDDAFKDKWELKQDLKKREWWEYGTKNSTTASTATSGKDLTDPSQMDDATRAQVARKLREEGATRDSLSPTRRTGADRSTSTHQYSALSMKELFQPGADAKAGRGSELGLNELFGNNSRSSTDRDPGALRRQEFRDFLNVSRVPKPAAPVEAGPSPLSPGSSPGAFNDPLQAGLRPVAGGRDGLGLNGAADVGRAPGASGFGNYYDLNRPSSYGPQANNNQSFRSLDSSRNLITPSMMEPPKRRF